MPAESRAVYKTSDLTTVQTLDGAVSEFHPIPGMAAPFRKLICLKRLNPGGQSVGKIAPAKQGLSDSQ
jgi:hypothetical protein